MFLEAVGPFKPKTDCSTSAQHGGSFEAQGSLLTYDLYHACHHPSTSLVNLQRIRLKTQGTLLSLLLINTQIARRATQFRE